MIGLFLYVKNKKLAVIILGGSLKRGSSRVATVQKSGFIKEFAHGNRLERETVGLLIEFT